MCGIVDLRQCNRELIVDQLIERKKIKNFRHQITKNETEQEEIARRLQQIASDLRRRSYMNE